MPSNFDFSLLLNKFTPVVLLLYMLSGIGTTKSDIWHPQQERLRGVKMCEVITNRPMAIYDSSISYWKIGEKF